MINYCIPDSKSLRKVNISFIDFIHKHPEMFINDISIQWVYGIFLHSNLSGGRVTRNENIQNIEDGIKVYNERGIKYRFVFSNSQITENDIDDSFKRQMDIAQKYKLGVIIGSDFIEQYIRENYSDVELISSVTKLLTLEESLKELKRFDVVVINNLYNEDLNTIPELLRNRCEILVNDPCNPLCSNRKNCYINTSLDNKQNRSISFRCRPCVKLNSVKVNHTLDINSINKLNNIGFINFKISGREKSSHALKQTYINYLVKPEYMKKIRDNVA